MPSRLRSAVVIVCGALAATCADTTSRGVGDVSEALRERTGARLRQESAADLPSAVSLEDGLSRSEAAAVALWNNVEFQVDVAELGFARAELAAAGVLRNPILSLLFPVGPKQLEASMTWPLQELWVRPRRVAHARMQAEQVADRLLTSGLDLVEAARRAHAEQEAACAVSELGSSSSLAWDRLAELADSRREAGDISRAEAAATRSQAARASDEARRLEIGCASRALDLLHVLGLDRGTSPLKLALERGAEPDHAAPVEALVARALASRPDVRAAELGVELAGDRAGLERSRILGLTAIADANGSGADGLEIGPGVGLELPLLDRKQGDVAVARAELERAVRRYAAVSSRVAHDVRQARLRFVEARESLRRWRASVLPGTEAALVAAEQAREAGAVSAIEVEEARLVHVGALRREIELRADLLRALARLENAVGRELERP